MADKRPTPNTHPLPSLYLIADDLWAMFFMMGRHICTVAMIPYLSGPSLSGPYLLGRPTPGRCKDAKTGVWWDVRCAFVCLSICLYVCPSVRLAVCTSVCGPCLTLSVRTLPVWTFSVWNLSTCPFCRYTLPSHPLPPCSLCP